MANKQNIFGSITDVYFQNLRETQIILSNELSTENLKHSQKSDLQDKGTIDKSLFYK